MNIPEILRELSEISKSLTDAQVEIMEAKSAIVRIQLDMALMSINVEEMENKKRRG